MGTRFTLKQVPGSLHAEASFLASEKGTWKEAGITVDSTLVGADANGDKILKAGTVMGQVTASKKWRAYVNNAADGSQTAVGFLGEGINLRDGDIVTGLLVGGSVRTARCSGLDQSAQTALTGRFILQ